MAGVLEAPRATPNHPCAPPLLLPPPGSAPATGIGPMTVSQKSRKEPQSSGLACAMKHVRNIA
jgi:hypothetical protein